MPETPISVLYLTDRSDRGESAMIRGMHQQGLKVRVMANLASPHVEGLAAAGIPVEDLRWRKKLDREALARIRAAVRNYRIDIVHALNSRTTLHMVLATGKKGRLPRPPRLVAYLGVTGNVSWLSPLSWFRFLNPRIDRIICVAEGVRRYLLEDVRFAGLRLDPRKVVTIHKGHSLDWYCEPPADLAEFGIPRPATVVAVASRLRRRKGLPELVRAIALIDPAKEIHVLFLGHEGDAELRAAARALRHPERIHFAGFRADAPALLAASTLCCLPVLRGEGLPRSVIEGMAHAVPAVVTDVGGNAELVVDGESGLVVPPGDLPALARAIEYLHDRPDERQRMGQAARERIATHFRSEDTVAKTIALYREVLAEPDRPKRRGLPGAVGLP